ncbi:MAG: amidohydrolase/deacetylase family metallohydrolase, partial [Bacteroidales bacterium]|nr:amidohydrolase/deacetylase family metallohydrolase [Bacteroidales bacterium]
EADVAIFDIKKGDYGFLVSGGEIRGTQRIENEITIRGGEIVYNLNGRITPVTLPPRPGQRGRI